MRLACTHTHTQKLKHLFGVYTKKGKTCVWRVHSGGNACVWRVHKKRGKHSFGVYTRKQNKYAYTKKKRKKHAFGVYTHKLMYFFFSFGVYTVVGMHVFGVYTKKGETFVWRVHTKKVENMCLVCTQKRKEKNNNKQIDVYIQKKTQTKQTNRQTKIRKKSKA